MRSAAKHRHQRADYRRALEKCKYFGLDPPDASLDFLYHVVCIECSFVWGRDGTVVKGEEDFHMLYVALAKQYGIPTKRPSAVPPTALLPTQREPIEEDMPDGSRVTKATSRRLFRLLDSDTDGWLSMCDLVDLMYVLGSTYAPLPEEHHPHTNTDDDVPDAEAAEEYRLQNVMSVRFTASQAARFESAAVELVPIRQDSLPHSPTADDVQDGTGAADEPSGVASQDGDEEWALNRFTAVDRQLSIPVFTQCWKRATGRALHPSARDAIFGERVNVSLHAFLRVCLSDCHKHSRRTFSSMYSQHRRSVASAVVNFALYLPLVIMYCTLVNITEKRESSNMYTAIASAFIYDTRYPLLPAKYPDDCYRQDWSDDTLYNVTAPHTNVTCIFGDYFKNAYFDTQNFDDVRDWMRDVLVPGFYNGSGLSLPRPGDFQPLLNNVVPVGALKIRAIRVNGANSAMSYKRYITSALSSPADIITASNLYQQVPNGLGTSYQLENGINTSSFSIAAMYPDAASAGVSQRVYDAFQYRTCDQLNGSAITVTGKKSNLYSCDGFALVLPSTLDPTVALADLAALNRYGWLDRANLAIISEVFFTNVDADTVGRLTALMETTSGGDIVVSFEVNTFQQFTRSQGQQSMLAIGCTVYIVLWFIATVIDLVQFIKNYRMDTGNGSLSGVVSGFAHYFTTNVWNLNLIACIAAVGTSLGLRVALIMFRIPANQLLQTSYYPALDGYFRTYTALEYSDGVTCLLVLLRLLHFTSLLPFMRAVTNVIGNTMEYIGAIAFIIGVTISGFFVAFSVAYGNLLIEFSSFNLGAPVIAFYAVASRDHFDAWNDALRIFTPIIFTAFQVLVLILTINMIIIVFTESFEKDQGNALNYGALEDLLEVDHKTRYLRPDILDWLRASGLVSELRFYVLFAYNRFSWFLSAADDKRAMDQQLATLRSTNPRTLWTLIGEALEKMDRGSQSDGIIGAATLAKLCSTAHLRQLEVQGMTLTLFDEVKEGTTSSTTLEVVEKLFDSTDQAHAMLQLFVEMPALLLGIDASVLLIELLDYRHRWKNTRERYTAHPAAIQLLQLRNEANKIRPWLDWVEGRDATAPSRVFTAAAWQRLHNPLECLVDYVESSPLVVSPTMSFSAPPAPVPGAPAVDVAATRATDMFDPATYLRMSNFTTPLSPAQCKLLTLHHGVATALVHDDTPAASLLVTSETTLEGSKEMSHQLASVWRRVTPSSILTGEAVYDALRGGDPTLVVARTVRAGALAYDDWLRNQLGLGWSTRAAMRIKTMLMRREVREELDLRAFTAVVREVEPIDGVGVKEQVQQAQRLFTEVLGPRGVTSVKTAMLVACCTKDGTYRRETLQRAFAQTRLLQLKDAVRLGWYLVFLALFVYNAFDDRGLGDGAFLTDAVYEQFVFQDYVSDGTTREFFVSVGTIPSWYNWTQLVLVPFLYTPSPDASIPAHPVVRSHHLIPIGALKLRQVRSTTNRCSSLIDAYMRPSQRPDYVQRWGDYFGVDWPDDECVDTFNPAFPNTDAFGNATAINMASFASTTNPFLHMSCAGLNGDDRTVVTDSRFFPCDGFAAMVPFNTPLADALNVVFTLQNMSWIDRYSVAVFAEFVLFDYDVQMFAKVSLAITTSNGRHWVPRPQVTVFRPFSFVNRTPTDQALMVLFLLTVLGGIFGFTAEFIDLCAARRRSARCSRASAAWWVFTRDAWWFLVLLIYANFITVWSIRLALALQPEVSVINLTTYPDHLDRIATLQTVCLLLDAVNAVLCFLRVLYYFRLNASVNILARSLYHASRVMIALLVTFIVVYLGFCVAGYIVFSAVLDEFASFGAVATTMMLFAFGNTKFEPMHIERRAYGSIFFAAYFIATAILILNLVLATMVMAFVKAKEEIYDQAKVRMVLKNDPHAWALFGRPSESLLNSAWSLLRGEIMAPIYAIRAQWNRGAPAKALGFRCRRPTYFWSHVVWILNEAEDPWGEFLRLWHAVVSTSGVSARRVQALRAALHSMKRENSETSLMLPGDGLQNLPTTMQRFLRVARTVETLVTPSLACFLRDELGDATAVDIILISMLASFATGCAPMTTLLVALETWHLRRLKDEAVDAVSGEEPTALEETVDRAAEALNHGIDSIAEAFDEWYRDHPEECDEVEAREDDPDVSTFQEVDAT